VNRILLLVIFQFCLSGFLSAQENRDTSQVPPPDTLQVIDSTRINDSLLALAMKDPLSKRPLRDDTWRLDTLLGASSKSLEQQVLLRHPFLGFNKEPLVIHSTLKKFTGQERIFYVLVALLLLFAFVRELFPKYFSDLFRLFFRTTLKQRQIREQLMQTPLPSLLLNGFFVLSTGLYIDFLLQHYHLDPVGNFWLLYLYCILALSGVYLVKFIGIKISGWLFNMPEAARAYIFVVFVVNKIIGIFLLPFLICLAFMQGTNYSVAMVLSWCGIGILLFYRVILTYAAVRNQVKVNPFHFFLYLCAFEIAPLLLIYKGLLVLFKQTT
jgi:hypothetical protein